MKKADVGGQAGEGLTVFAESEEGPNAVFTPSNRIVVSTLFSTGVGPVYENDTDGMPGFPYRGKAGITELDALTKSRYTWNTQAPKGTEPIKIPRVTKRTSAQRRESVLRQRADVERCCLR